MEGKREGRAGLADVAAFVHLVYSLPSSKLIRLSESESKSPRSQPKLNSIMFDLIEPNHNTPPLFISPFYNSLKTMVSLPSSVLDSNTDQSSEL